MGGERANVGSYLKNAVVIHDELEEAAPTGARTIRFLAVMEDSEVKGDLVLDFSAVLRFHTPLDFAADLRERIESDAWRAIVVASDPEKVWNLLVDQGLNDADLTRVSIVAPVTGSSSSAEVGAEPVTVSRALSSIPEAFQSRSLKLLLITEREIFGSFGGERRRRLVAENADAAFLATLAPGDLVVHIDYGIAIFRGVEQKTVAGTTREYLSLEYAQRDKLFTPVDQADKVNKYIGATGENAPALTRLGSTDWSTVTRSARKETLEVAKELLELYALRESSSGFAFKPDDEVVRQFEREFSYVETPGQVRTIQEVKADMEKAKPMDRLVCGDVGFGKTEIGMRAAFKAVRSGKQVAYLAPITILVAQQFEAFRKRMAHFDVRVDMLSRFVTAADQRRVLQDLKLGKIDIVVGTHRLLEEDVAFHDLGLLIIDEEQRFGVRQKERLKKLRASVDILTLTATPVPRTLNMALSGLRDISTITTPPPGRLPIATEVRRFSLTFIRDVLVRELERKGQVYFLHNRVQTIESTAQKLRELVPEARIVVAHGQLPAHELEDRIMAFKDQEFDVLVSSTIIENGIDLPNANTLVVDRAERLGLAQAYQLRGRVGRAKTQAYAYFLYHSQKLDETAKKRLRAIVEASELGSGFQIALRDLEIRGAGDILGDKQHGTISAIGVTHFTRLLRGAVESMRSGKTKEELLEAPPQEAAIELTITAFLPESYIPREAEKLKMYQRLAGCTTDAALKTVVEELVAAYGEPPQEAKNLLSVLAIKLAASLAGVSHVKEGRSGGDDMVELLFTKEVKPAAIMQLLAFESRWLVTGTSVKIPKASLGTNWFGVLRDHISQLILPEEKPKTSTKKAKPQGETAPGANEAGAEA